MTQESSQTDNITFSVDTSLLFQLGEQLVSRPSIALAELVKNAYDADATHVSVTMEQIGAPGGTILIEDDGHGMTFEELQNTWMRIATDAKRKQSVSRRYCRPLTGAKGVGRFAARRLGSKLLLQTIAQRPGETKELVKVEFDWHVDFQPGKDLSRIPVRYSRHKVPSGSPTGVSLLIEGVRDAWTKDEIGLLQRDLLSLQSPFPDLIKRADEQNDENQTRDPGFHFKLIVEGSEQLDRLSGGLDEAFLGAAWARLDGRVDDNGTPRYELNVLRTNQEETLVDTSNVFDGLKGVRLRVYFMVYVTEEFRSIHFNMREIQAKGREEGGVKIYLDGFRVFPYGEKGDDWLQLDEYSGRNVDLGQALPLPVQLTELSKTAPHRAFLLIPKNYQLFGAISISQTEQSNIEINIARDRLIQTPTVLQLRHFVQNGLYWMTLRYAAYRKQRDDGQSKTRRETVPQILESAKASLATEPAIPEDQRRVIMSRLDQAIERAKEVDEERISEISMLRVLASAGTTISIMNHQLQAITDAVLQTQTDLQRLRPEIPGELLDRYDDICTQIGEWHNLVKMQVSQLGFLLSPDNRQRRRRYALHELVENVRHPMAYYMKTVGVQFENDVPRNLRTPPIHMSELYAILINILSNALKAVYGKPLRRVRVEADRRSNGIAIRMFDTGTGVPLSRREIVFQPFETTSLPNPILGVGTGLGLKVVSDILEIYGGTARFIDAPQPWRTCIEIVLPDRGDSHVR